MNRRGFMRAVPGLAAFMGIGAVAAIPSPASARPFTKTQLDQYAALVAEHAKQNAANTAELVQAIRDVNGRLARSTRDMGGMR